jgi:hypothetical protein
MPWFANPLDNPVQMAQQEYDLTMQGHRARVTAGEITEGEFWRIADGEPLRICGQKIAAAIAAYEAEHPPRRRKPSRRERAWKRGHVRDMARRKAAGIAEPAAGQIMARIAGIRP